MEYIIGFLLGVLVFCLVSVLAPLVFIYREIVGRITSIKHHRNVFTFIFSLCLAICASIIGLWIIMMVLTDQQISVFQNKEWISNYGSSYYHLSFSWKAQLFEMPDKHLFWWWFMWAIFITAATFVTLTFLPFIAISKRTKLRHVGLASSKAGWYLSMNDTQILKAIRSKYKKLPKFQIRLNNKPKEDYQKMGLAAEKQFSKDHKGYLKREKNLSNDNFDGFADFVSKDMIYEIKSTSHHKDSAMFNKYMNEKYIPQLKLYLYLSKKHTKGQVVVYNALKKPNQIATRSVTLTKADILKYEKLEKSITRAKEKIYSQTHKHWKLYRD